MPKMTLKRSVHIEASAEHVYGIVADLGNWRPWNPWLVTDTEAEVTVAPDGKAYSWQGKRTGEGAMRITSEEKPRKVELDLSFLKPFKSEAKVVFTVEAQGEGCTVTWSMNGGLPFFLFFLKKMMTTLIGMDYERGLGMLKDFAESGTVPSKVNLLGESEYAGCNYVGISRECAIDDLGPAMSADFKKLQSWYEQAGEKPSGDAFSIYRKWDLSRGKVKYTSGIPLDSAPGDLPSGLESGSIPRLKTYVLEHVGPYRHLGNAWSTGMQMGRGKEFTQSKQHTPFETYPLGVDGILPGGDSDENTRTSIHFAIK